MTDYRYYIGIDPGTTTGLAVWDRDTQQFYALISGTLIEVYMYLRNPNNHAMPAPLNFPKNAYFRIEDARQRKWYGQNSTAKAQGAGSIKRDCAIWEEICEYHGWDYEMVHPLKGATKWDHQTFCNATGYAGGQTNEHNRDAAMIVYDF